MGTQDDKIIGSNISAYRKSLKMSQQDLASHIGISREELSYYETGSRPMPTALISILATYFGVDEYDLFQTDTSTKTINMAFAFRAGDLKDGDKNAIADFKKIAMNYLKMQRIAQS